MKPDTHPALNPVIFIDSSTKDEFITRSTLTSKETREIEGVTHYVVKADISEASHPFYTGTQKIVDSAGRVERFQNKYGSISLDSLKRR
jgi:large subunit ribosomal protein L31